MKQLVTRRRISRLLPAALACLTSIGLTPALLLASGEAVPLNAVNVPPGATMTITFEVDVDSPLAVCATAISNQGTVTGTGINVLSDDPDVAGAANPTLTGLDAIDLAITKTDGASSEIPGTPVTYTIVASNAGPAPAIGATVADTFPAAITGVNWTCVGAGGGTCTAAGAGNISDTVNLPVGGSVTYTATGTIQAGATGTLANTATITKAAAQLECNLANNSATDTDTLTPQVDLAITKTDGQTSINAGSATSYTIAVTNSGPSDAVGASVADIFPADLTGASWTCASTPGSSCTAGPTAGNLNDTVTVLSGGTLTYTVNATVSGAFSGTLANTATLAAPGGTTDTNAGNNSATDTTTVNAVADLSITKTDGVTTAVPGQSVTYTITASNAGPSTASSATVADTFPAVLTCSWTCVGAGGGTCPASGSGILNASVNLPSGGSATFTASCTISAAATGTLVNTATISSGVTDPSLGNNSASDIDTLTPQSDVSITKTDGSPSEVPGTPVTYTIVASNAGPSTATGVTVADTFPASLSGCSTTIVAAGGATGNDAGPVAGNLNDSGITLPPSATVTFTAVCNVDAAATGTLSNTATIASATTDPVPGNNSATDSDTLTSQTDLSITKTDGSATEIPGTPVTYTIVASNAGPSTATGVGVSDTFAAVLSGCSWTSVASGGATGSTAGPVSGDIAESGMTFPPAAIVTYTATCNIAANATGTLANTATVTSATTDPNAGNNSATDTDTLAAQFDLAITKTDGQTSVNAGSATSYTIVVSNSGPSTATGASVADTFPAVLLSPTWTCVATPGSTCTAGPAAGNLNDSATIAASGSVTYTVSATVDGTASGTLSNTATVTLAGDTNAGNNSATDTTTINPVADLSITKTDGVTTAVPGMTVTYTIVAANAGPATATAAAVADTFPAACTSVSWTCAPTGVGASCTAGPVAGNIADSATLPASTSATYTAICTLADNATGSLANTATIGGGGVSDTNSGNNSASDTDTILPLDFGDAPGSAQGPPWAYPTLLAANGARHGVNGGGALRMGALLDTEGDGQPTLAADGDDQVSVPNVDDEDGVTLPATLVACGSANVTVNASAVAKLDAFIDFDRNGSFADAGEKIFDNQALAAGANVLPFNVPCTATPTTLTFARFRISSAGGLASNGVAADGEVEDYTVALRGLDFGDAADPAYPTLLASNGARHVVVTGAPVLGSLIDTEANGQPSAGATGDDLAGTDDEDGVAFTSPLVRGQNASVTVTASAPGVLNAWLDFNGDGNWTTTGDAIFVNAALVAGANNLTFPVPATATTNLSTVARFRFATAGGLSFNGLANDGEVEDHAVATAAEADVAITKTDGAATEVPGTTVTYTIVASNNGPDAATGVTVADTFAGILSGCSTTSVAAGGASGNDAGPVAGSFSDDSIGLPVGGTVTYTATCTIAASATGSLANTATISSATGDPVSGNNSATDTDTLTPQTDLAVTKTDGATTEVPGTPVTYTLVVTNAGPSDAVGATVADTFPAFVGGVTWTCVGAGGGTCPANGAGNINALVGLPAAGAASVTFTATGTISAAATGTLSNTATIAAGAGATDPVPGNNSATDTDTLSVESDLAITKTDGSASEVPGTPVTYTITATNAGPSDNPAATVADTFPAIVSGVTWTCIGAGGGTCPAGGAGNINTVVNLPAGGSVSFTATGTIASSATGSLSNTATVAAAGGTIDPNPGNNSATDTDSLVPSADIQITKDDSADPPPAGQDLIYTLTVTNLGPSDATGVAVSDPLPAEVTYISDDCGGIHTPPWGWTIGDLAAGASAVCNITVSVNPAPPASISNTASVTSTTTDPNSANDSDTEVTTLDAVPPQVTNVGSVLDTGDGTLDECETANVGISALTVTFDEAMANPPDDSFPDDVTNPANYLVVTPGPDFDFATVGCGGAAGDDVALAVTGVAYDGGSHTATVALAAPLPAAQIRLFVCDSLTDLAGNALDGDADTNAGGDFRRAFRADPGNVFANGHFDCDAADWNAVAATPAEISWTGSDDADDADDSGSVHFTNLAPGVDTSFRLWQCYDIPPATSFDVEARVKLDAAPGDFIGFSRRCEFFSAPGCTGSLGVQTAALALQDSGGAWLSLSSVLNRPAGSVAARCDFSFETATGESFDGWLDATRFASTGGLFSDGFESGNTSAWSATVP